MKTMIIDEKAFFTVARAIEGSMVSKLPPGVYTLKFNARDEKIMIFSDRVSYTAPGTVYGKCKAYHDAVVDAYKKSNESMGALFLGEKGEGKSMTAEMICNTMAERFGMATVCIDENLPAGVIRMVARALSPVVLYFDEFGKVYPESSSDVPSQEDLLTVFSDTDDTKNLFILTSNLSDKFCSQYIDRPGRFKFKFNMFNSVVDNAAEIIKQNNIPKHLIPAISRWAVRDSVDEVARQRASCNMDSFLQVIEMSKTVPDLKTWHERMTMMNVSDPALINIFIHGLKINGKPAHLARRVLNEPSDESLHEMILGCHMSHVVTLTAECEDGKEVTINWDLGDGNTIVSESYFNDHPTKKYSRVQRDVELTLPTGEFVNISFWFGNRNTPEFIALSEFVKVEIKRPPRSRNEPHPFALSQGGGENAG